MAEPSLVKVDPMPQMPLKHVYDQTCFGVNMTIFTGITTQQKIFLRIRQPRNVGDPEPPPTWYELHW